MRSPRAPRSSFLDSVEWAAATEKGRRSDGAKRRVGQSPLRMMRRSPPSGRPAAISRQAPLALFARHSLAPYSPAFRLRQRSPVLRRPAASLSPMPVDAFRLAVAPPMTIFAGSVRAGSADGGPQAARHRFRVPPRSAEHKRPPPLIGAPSNYPSASPLRCRGGVTSAPAGLLPGRIVSRPGGQVHFPSHRPFNWR